MLSIEEAQKIILEQSFSPVSEFVSLQEACGRVLCENICADRDYPPYHRAAMDGYAFRSADFLSKNIRRYFIKENIYAGALPEKNITEGECYKIMTGASVPPDADAVIRVEDTESKDGFVFFNTDKIRQGQNIATKGEDAKAGTIILNKNTLLRPVEIATLAALGKSLVPVFKKIKVSVISTGNEVVDILAEAKPHQIRESNSYGIEAFMKSYGELNFKSLVKDEKEDLKSAFMKAQEADLVILSGGVSMGDKDFVPEVLEACGVKKLFHKVAIKPGKPLWFGKKENTVVFALPGNPLSVQVACKIFVEPFIRNCYGLAPDKAWVLPMAVGRKKKTILTEFFLCRLEIKNGISVNPLANNGSGDISSVVNSDGIACQESEELGMGGLVKYWAW